MIGIIAFLENPSTWLMTAIAIIIGLVAVIFNSMVGRISELEEKCSQCPMLLKQIAEDIKHIKRHCSHCMDAE